jgi:hypothetical protein
LHSRTKLAPEVGIAPTSRLFQSRANLPQLFGEMVVLAGNAPASSGYQPGALLLSYETWRKASVMLRPRRCRSCFRDKCSQLISACLPKLAARVGLAPTPHGLTGRRATLTLPGNGAAGRTLTCIVPFRRRMPDIFDHGSKLKLVSAAGVAPAIPRSQAECVGCYATR